MCDELILGVCLNEKLLGSMPTGTNLLFVLGKNGPNITQKPADVHLLWFTENCSSKNSVKLSEFRVLHATFIGYTCKKLNASDQNFL